MKQSLPITFVLASALFGTGCATKKYVRQTVDPVSGKLDTVAQQSTQQGQKLDQTSQSLDQTRQSLDQTRQTMQKDETELSATKERAMTADNRAGDAMNRADAANRGVNDVRAELRSVVANLDDYKQVAGTTLNFKFNSDKLSADGKQQLDQMVANQSQYKRYFVAVEGFTDSVGSVDYNAALSRRRADAVVEYLVAQHDIPIYRIHMVGLGKMKPLEDAHTRAAQAKNRRVEVTLLSADAAANNMTGSPASMAPSGAQGNTGGVQGNGAPPHGTGNPQ